MKIYSVSQVNAFIKNIIDNEVILEDIAVTGELSSFSITRNIAYFTLKDNDNLLSCIQFGCKQEFNVGDMVKCVGNIKYYPKGGKLSLNALTIELCGQGEYYQRFLEMKQKLESEGLFDSEHKIPIPKYIQSIGVVTSKTGAVLQDIRNVSARRNPNLDIYVYDAQVQGKYAVDDVIDGITYFDNFSDVDVIVVARGGGSLEDLAPFNDENLARIAYICNKPLISAVGHETDFSILDFVADLRAPTPSAAAEIVSFDNFELKRYIKDIVSNIQNKTESVFDSLKLNTDLMINQIERVLTEKIDIELTDIKTNQLLIDKYIENILINTIHRVELCNNTLNKLNPERLFKIGYSSVVNSKNKTINTKNVDIGDEIIVTSNKLRLNAQVTKKENL